LTKLHLQAGTPKNIEKSYLERCNAVIIGR
jgi:hypothetical protein